MDATELGTAGGLTENAKTAVTTHLTHYLAQDSSVLEISSESDSLLPKDIKYKNTFAVGLADDALLASSSRVFRNFTMDCTIPVESNSISYVSYRAHSIVFCIVIYCL